MSISILNNVSSALRAIQCPFRASRGYPVALFMPLESILRMYLFPFGVQSLLLAFADLPEHCGEISLQSIKEPSYGAAHLYQSR